MPLVVNLNPWFDVPNASTTIVPPLIFCWCNGATPPPELIHSPSPFPVPGALKGCRFGAVKVGTTIVGLATSNDNVGGNSGFVTFGAVIGPSETVGVAASTSGASGGVICILGALNEIACGWAIGAGILSAIVIAPFTTCFGLIAALTLNPTVGSNKGLTPTNP